MKLVTAAKVRRAQEVVFNSCPFSETLVEVLYNINEQLQTKDINVPLINVRPVKKVALVVVIGDCCLCGAFNNTIIKKAVSSIEELKDLGVDYTIISVGKKGNPFFLYRPHIPVNKFLEGGSLPRAKEAQAIVDDVFSLFVSEEVDCYNVESNQHLAKQGEEEKKERGVVPGRRGARPKFNQRRIFGFEPRGF